MVHSCENVFSIRTKAEMLETMSSIIAIVTLLYMLRKYILVMHAIPWFFSDV